ncbi:MAG: hypothetical protein RIA69_08320 [Cyclobacteriaceae bacterium]
MNWIKDADLVIEGEYITNLSYSSETREHWNSENKGFDVLFKVTRVIKGRLLNDTIAIIQFENGSCLTTFDEGKKYTILGDQILNFKCLEHLKPEADSDGEYPPTDNFQPPSYLNDEGSMNYNYCDDQETRYWNEITKNYITLYTNYCTTYPASSQIGKLIRKE